MQIDRRRGRKKKGKWYEGETKKTDAEINRERQRNTETQGINRERCRPRHWGTRAAIWTGKEENRETGPCHVFNSSGIMWLWWQLKWFWFINFNWLIVESEHLLKINFQKQNCHKLPRGLIGGQNLKLVSDLIGWIDTKNFLMRKMKEWTRLGDYISFPCHGQELMTKNDDVISRHNRKI